MSRLFQYGEKGITKVYTLLDDSQIESRLSSDFSDSCS